jgi:hypothetical protein
MQDSTIWQYCFALTASQLTPGAITVSPDRSFEAACVQNASVAAQLEGSLRFTEANATTQVTLDLPDPYLQDDMLPTSGSYSVLACP